MKLQSTTETNCPTISKNSKIMSSLAGCRVPAIFRDKTLEDYIISGQNQEVIKALQVFKNGRGLYLEGKSGSGKTMLASLLLIEHIRSSKRKEMNVFLTSNKLLSDINPRVTENWQRNKWYIMNAEVLVVDDLGVEKSSDWTYQTLFEVIDSRYTDNLQTIITSNFNLLELQKRWNSYEGERIIRRIKAICEEIQVNKYK